MRIPLALLALGFAPVVAHADAPWRPAHAALAPGSLTVASQPWARLFVDGADSGLNTPVLAVPLAPGRHQLELVTDDGQRYRTVVQVHPGERLRLAHDFAR
jgi:hypothetical protein